MRIVWGVVFGVVSLVLALVFAILAVTKIASGYWFGYLAIAVYALGAFGCARAARQNLAPAPRAALPMRAVVGVALGLASVALATFAIRSAVFATTGSGSRSSAAHFEFVLSLIDGVGAVGCFIAARPAYARERHRGVASSIVR